MRALVCLALLAFSSSSVGLAAEHTLAPALASVDDPRQARERPRLTYVLHEEGIESFIVRPRAEPSSARTTLLLVFPSTPKLRVVPAGALEALAAAAGFDGASLEERASLLPPSPADADVEVLGSSLDAATGWLRRHAPDVDERTQARLQAAVDAGLVLVGVDAPSPAPPLGFRFASERLLLPVDLLAPDDEQQRLLVISDAPVQFAGEPNAYRDRQLAGPALEQRLVASPALAPARELIAHDVAAAREGRLLTAEDERRAALLDVSRRLSLSGVAVTPLLPPVPSPPTAAEPDASTKALRERTLSVLEGDLPDALPSSTEAAFEPVDDDEAPPLVRRFQDNRIFRLLQKVWD